MKNNMQLHLLVAVGLGFAACSQIHSMHTVRISLPVPVVVEVQLPRPKDVLPSVYRYLQTFWARPGVAVDDNSTALEILGLKADATSDEISSTYMSKKMNHDIEHSPAALALPESDRAKVIKQFHDLTEWARVQALQQAEAKEGLAPQRPKNVLPQLYVYLENFWARPGVHINDRSNAFEWCCKTEH